MPTPIRGQSITAPPKVYATLSNTSSNTVQNQAVANALAGAYDATATYAVGDLCIYDGILYECTTAITTAEAWDATHWKTGNFGEKVSDLNRHLSDVKDDITDTQGMLATVETTATASKNYAVGDLLVYDGKLYKVTSAIAAGATITVGTNVTQTTVESQIASGGDGGGGEDNWCVIANMELTEALGSATASQVFLDLTTDINGNLLSDKKIRHLAISVHYANSDDGLPNGATINLNGSGAASGGILLDKDRYTIVKIDVLNSTHVLCWTSGATQSFGQSNVVMAGAYAAGGNILNNKDTIDRVRLRTNYPNGTILPAGSSIVITGW